MLVINRTHPSSSSGGFSLIELMVAMVVGLLIIAGVMSLYVSTRDAQRVNEEQLQMVANARFVINSLGYDIKHAGSWGGTMLDNVIWCTAGDARCPAADQLPLATGDCAAFDYITLSQPIIGFDDNNPYGATCASNSYSVGTDMLQLKYADSSFVTTGSLAADTVYIRANSGGGSLFEGNVFPPHMDDKSWRAGVPYDVYTFNYPLRSNIYYVSSNTDPGDGIPSLRKSTLVAGPEFDDEVLLSGVEDFQVQYGIVDGVNTNPGDFNTVVSYVDADSIPTNVDWQNVKTVKLWVLMRGDRVDRDGVAISQTFNIANKGAVTFSDGYRRMLVSGVIKLRNTERLGESVQAGNN